MLKLYNYYFKNLFKSHLPFYLVLIINSIIEKTLNFSQETIIEYPILGIVKSVISTLNYLLIVGLIIFSFIKLISLFKRKLLSDEAYLTHTLPLSQSKIIGSIYLNIFTFIIINILVLLLSRTIIDFKFLKQFDDNILTVGLLFILVIFVFLHYISQFNLALSIGYSTSNNKIRNTIIAGVVLYFVNQLFGGILVVIIFFTFGKNTSINGNSVLAFVNTFYLFIFVISYTLINIYITKRLNLE